MLVRRALGLGVRCASSFSLLPFGLDDSSKQADVEMQRIADAVKDHDAGALRKLFSTAASENATRFDSGLKYFLSVFPTGRMT
jgi:hypothetical protein